MTAFSYRVWFNSSLTASGRIFVRAKANGNWSDWWGLFDAHHGSEYYLRAGCRSNHFFAGDWNGEDLTSFQVRGDGSTSLVRCLGIFFYQRAMSAAEWDFLGGQVYSSPGKLFGANGAPSSYQRSAGSDRSCSEIEDDPITIECDPAQFEELKKLADAEK